MKCLKHHHLEHKHQAVQTTVPDDCRRYMSGAQDARPTQSVPAEGLSGESTPSCRTALRLLREQPQAAN